MMTLHTCVCGREFEGGPHAKYCPDCRKEMHRERNSKYERKIRKGGAKRMLGTLVQCAEPGCGEFFEKSAPNQKYCPSCQQEHAVLRDRERALTYYNEHKEVKWERRCIQCGRTFTGKVRARYCSDECRNDARRERDAYKKARREAKAQAERLEQQAQQLPWLSPSEELPWLSSDK